MAIEAIKIGQIITEYKVRSKGLAFMLGCCLEKSVLCLGFFSNLRMGLCPVKIF